MHHSPPLVWLHAAGRPDEAAMGAKAARLARLARAGLPVPEGFCISPAAFHEALTRLGVTDLDGGDASWGGALRRVALGPLLQASVAEALRRLGRGPLAVRSSAVGEDAADRSFAGQYETVLGVRGLAAVTDAIRHIWASFFAARAAAYRGGRRPGEAAGMAVLVQRQVDARVSGILFTANPMSGSPREMTIEAVPGLGERLAAGEEHPDLWICSRPLRPRRDAVLEVADRTRAPGRTHPLLADDEVLEVARLGLRVEDQLGGPQDIEWSTDGTDTTWLLQARPITTLQTSIRRRGAETVLWTQRFSGERWTEQASPLGWSIMQPVLHHFIHWEEASRRYLGGAPPTMLYHGVPYVNITIFRHLAFRLPGMAPIQFMVELFPPQEQELMRRRTAYLPDARVVGSILGQVIRERRWRRYRFNFLTNHRIWERFQPELVGRVARLDVTFDDPAAGLLQVERARRLIVEYVEIHLLSLLFANVFYQLSGATLRRWCGEGDRHLRAALTSEPGGNRTVAGHKALWQLAGLAQQIPAVERALLDGDPPPALEELARLPDGGPFAEEVRAFLREYGHRSSASWEIFATRWAEDPSVVLRMIAGYLRGGIHTDPYVNEERHRQRYRQALEELERRLDAAPGQRLLPWKKAAARSVVEMARVYMRLRENQRFDFDRLLYRVKRVFLRLGELLVERGVLDETEDITYLTVDEVQAAVGGALDGDAAREIVARRRAEARLDRRVEHPEFLVGDGAPLPSAMDHRRLLQGLGISPGRATGTVRVLRSLDELHKLRRGDILVTRATDPGWTPLFLTAGGLVMELGSLLSHGAVVAREYALPAVVNVSGATRRLRDGQRVTLDGSRGLVYVL